MTHAADMELISLAELEEIRRIWMLEKHEVEDSLPGIYERATNARYPGKELGEHLALGRDEMELLREVCGDDRVHYELTRESPDVERRHRMMSRRRGLFAAIDDAIGRGFCEPSQRSGRG